MEAEVCEVLYRFFRTASEYIEGHHSAAPYPETFELSAVSTAAECADESAPACCGLSGQNAVEDSSEAFQSLQAVYAAVSCCAACRLAATRTKPVGGEGPEELSHLTNSVEVMVIGEGPGADEDRQGRPFVGRAGQLLDKMLEAIQLSRKTNCYITNVVKCRPPQNRDPAPDERECCAAFLAAQIRLTRPKLILVVGRIAAQHLLQTSEGIGKLRGRFFDYQGIPLMPTYHPSALLRDESLKRPAWEDLKRFRARLQELRADEVSVRGS
ncbi:MAG: uracil-DNA glycosylase [Treponema sp.]